MSMRPYALKRVLRAMKEGRQEEALKWADKLNKYSSMRKEKDAN